MRTPPERTAKKRPKPVPTGVKGMVTPAVTGMSMHRGQKIEPTNTGMSTVKMACMSKKRTTTPTRTAAQPRMPRPHRLPSHNLN
jgi:hypothetical protein